MTIISHLNDLRGFAWITSSVYYKNNNCIQSSFWFCVTCFRNRRTRIWRIWRRGLLAWHDIKISPVITQHSEEVWVWQRNHRKPNPHWGRGVVVSNKEAEWTGLLSPWTYCWLCIKCNYEHSSWNSIRTFQSRAKEIDKQCERASKTHLGSSDCVLVSKIKVSTEIQEKFKSMY